MEVRCDQNEHLPKIFVPKIFEISVWFLQRFFYLHTFRKSSLVKSPATDAAWYQDIYDSGHKTLIFHQNGESRFTKRAQLLTFLFRLTMFSSIFYAAKIQGCKLLRLKDYEFQFLIPILQSKSRFFNPFIRKFHLCRAEFKPAKSLPEMHLPNSIFWKCALEEIYSGH